MQWAKIPGSWGSVVAFYKQGLVNTDEEDLNVTRIVARNLFHRNHIIDGQQTPTPMYILVFPKNDFVLVMKDLMVKDCMVQVGFSQTDDVVIMGISRELFSFTFS